MTTQDTRATLTGHALRLFLERGYEGTSLGDLVSASGLSKGAVYHHFRNKEELFEAAISHFFLQFLPKEEPDALAQDLRTCVTAMVDGYCAMLTAVAAVTADRLAYYRFLIAIAPKISAQLRQRIALGRDLIRQAASREQEAGTLGERHAPDEIAEQCLALIEGGGLLATIEAGAEDPSPRLRALVTTYLDGLYRP